MHWHVYSDDESLAQACADFIAEAIADTLGHKALCHVALPGGNTPARCFQLLAVQDLDWQRVFWLPADERTLPAGHQERNDTMIRANLCALLPNGDDNLITIPTELGTEQAAVVINEKLKTIDSLDIALLGMGEDGHTASLFPGDPALDGTDAAVAVYQSPKPPPQRVSLSLNYLQQCRYKVVLTRGEGKREIIQRIKTGEAFPITMLGNLHWFIDASADG
ncbi:MAG: 6-phosphogluconolactonase [Gammaproteobacteria bacterium]|nr:6-phosphogluconolactonase [Gammaproteobacteria bacterium]